LEGKVKACNKVNNQLIYKVIKRSVSRCTW